MWNKHHVVESIERNKKKSPIGRETARINIHKKMFTSEFFALLKFVLCWGELRMPTCAALPLNDIAHILFGMHVILFFFSIILLFFSMLYCVCVYLLASSGLRIPTDRFFAWMTTTTMTKSVMRFIHEQLLSSSLDRREITEIDISSFCLCFFFFFCHKKDHKEDELAALRRNGKRDVKKVWHRLCLGGGLVSRPAGFLLGTLPFYIILDGRRRQ